MNITIINKLYYVYLIVTIKKKRAKSYVGYTNDIKKRIFLHNRGLGAKSTRGYQWRLIYKKRFKNKKKAMKYEYYLKRNKKLRKEIKEKNEVKNNYF